MNKITVRAAKVEDLSQLDELMYQLHDHHHKAEPKLFKTSEEVAQEKSIHRYLDHPECLVYVAVSEQDKIVGFITGHFCELVSSICKAVPMGSIDELFVIEEFRSCDVAKSLFQKIESTLSDYGVQQIFVEVWDFNLEAQGFYRKMAFKPYIHTLHKSLID